MCVCVYACVCVWLCVRMCVRAPHYITSPPVLTTTDDVISRSEYRRPSERMRSRTLRCVLRASSNVRGGTVRYAGSAHGSHHC